MSRNYDSLLDEIKYSLYERDSLQNEVAQLKSDKERLIKICYRLTENIYRYLGEDLPKEFLVKLVDSCIGNEAYKTYLYETYIMKKPTKVVDINEVNVLSEDDLMVDETKISEEDLETINILNEK